MDDRMTWLLKKSSSLFPRPSDFCHEAEALKITQKKTSLKRLAFLQQLLFSNYWLEIFPVLEENAWGDSYGLEWSGFACSSSVIGHLGQVQEAYNGEVAGALAGEQPVIYRLVNMWVLLNDKGLRHDRFKQYQYCNAWKFVRLADSM